MDYKHIILAKFHTWSGIFSVSIVKPLSWVLLSILNSTQEIWNKTKSKSVILPPGCDANQRQLTALCEAPVPVTLLRPNCCLSQCGEAVAWHALRGWPPSLHLSLSLSLSLYPLSLSPFRIYQLLISHNLWLTVHSTTLLWGITFVLHSSLLRDCCLFFFPSSFLCGWKTDVLMVQVTL